MWQRFTERARRVILLGQEEASRMNNSYVGTEHLLLGLVRENEGVAAQVLQKMGVSLQRVRQEIEAAAEASAEGASSEPRLTPPAKRVLELAADESRRMRHNYIGTEHLLLALLREKDGLAAKVLRKLGFDLANAREQVLEYLGPEATPSGGKAPERHEASVQVSEVPSMNLQVLDWILPMLMHLLPREMRDMWRQLYQLNREKEAALLQDDYERAAIRRNEANEIEKRMEEFAAQWQHTMNQSAPQPAPTASFDLTPAIVENLIVQIEAAIDALSAGDAEKMTEKVAEVKRNLATLKNELRGA